MGYDIYITRRKTWSDEEGPEISLTEWKAIVDADPQLQALASTVENPLTAMMLSPHKVDPGARYFFYSHGDIFVGKPCRDVLMKMLQIAQSLGARVIGEADEIYSADGSPDRPAPFVVGPEW